MTKDTRPRLAVVVASTRPGRVGKPIGDWVKTSAKADGRFICSLVDLAEQDLPLLDEPHHPRLRDYTKAHTRRWSDLVEEIDAFIFVLPEYNAGYNASLKNALDFLFEEWHYKPVAFVSYGGISAGTRATQQVKQVVSALKMVPLSEGVAIPSVAERFSDGEFASTPAIESSLGLMFDEIHRWSDALAPLRPIRE